MMAAIVIGFGGSLLFANIVSPTAPKPELTKLDQRMSQQPIQAAAAPSEPVKNAAPAPAAAPNENAAAPSPVQASTAQPNPANAVPPATPPVAAATSAQPVAPAQPAAAPAPQPVVAATQPAQQEPRAAPAREEPSAADGKRTAEKRKVDRRQQWAEKRRYYQRQDSQSRQDLELRAVEEAIREETVPRREFAAEPVRSEMPVIRLFGMD